ncbi:hypothetical protein ACFLZV_04250 [Candidatus Margulisiibacteriota bacterium]
MLTGKQKSRVLISLLGDKSQTVLKKLSKENVQLLTSSLEDVPEPDTETMAALLTEIIDKLDELKGPSSKEEHLSFDLDMEQPAEPEAEEEALEESLEEPAPEEEAEEEPEEEAKDPLLSLEPTLITDLLSSSSPQIIAFFLSKLDEEVREVIEPHFSKEITDIISKIKIEETPNAELVFDNLKKYIITTIKKKLEEEAEAEAEKSQEADQFTPLEEAPADDQQIEIKDSGTVTDETTPEEEPETPRPSPEESVEAQQEEQTQPTEEAEEIVQNAFADL